ncbi:TadE family protein [Lachnoanaerobaculum umeaense]|uniref:Pilus assembly protein n=1 Tax=Lachnoanaerobaculum umeaense TaxID=617123 RepID=A0A385Q329_9FIRM|nr:TadE family protein [Lachnoanaerobaculum umeaense]AYB00035.1 pilus assembly protein [Lachnoanaerobaculum umeaense]PZW97464.1 hypothetical protein C7439_10978 [Lachnoanaerobaculum umeaense]
MRIENNRGALMVEAALIYPLFMLTIVAMLVLGLLKLEQSLIQFGATKIASQAAREAAYPGYEKYLAAVSNGIDIDVISFPNTSGVDSFYKDRELYAGFFRSRDAIGNNFEEKLNELLLKYTMVSGITVDSDIEITGIITPTVKTNVKYGIRLPDGLGKVLSLVGVPSNFNVQESSYAFSSNATEFVRDIDLGADLIDFLLERFNLKERVDVYVNKLKTLRDRLGGTGR